MRASRINPVADGDRVSRKFDCVTASNPSEDSASLIYNYAGAIDGVACRTLERLIAPGEGPAVIELSPSRRGIIDTDLQAWLKQRRRSPPSEARKSSMNP
jgi:hypothetical protein